MIAELFADKSLKPKEKTERLCVLLEKGEITSDELLQFAEKAKDPVKASCIEVFEYVSKTNPKIVSKAVFRFAVANLSAKAPRIKWESAKVIGNAVSLYTKDLDEAVIKLLENSEHEGTVVRWSAAFALSEIIKLKTPLNTTLVPAVESLIKREEKASIRKIYEAAMKKASYI